MQKNISFCFRNMYSKIIPLTCNDTLIYTIIQHVKRISPVALTSVWLLVHKWDKLICFLFRPLSGAFCARGHVAHNLFEWKRCIRCTFNCAHAVSVYTGRWYDIVTSCQDIAVIQQKYIRVNVAEFQPINKKETYINSACFLFNGSHEKLISG